MRIFNDDRLVVIYEIPSTKGNLVQDKRFYADRRKECEMNRRRYGHSKPGKGRAKRAISPSKPLYDMSVDIRPIDVSDQLSFLDDLLEEEVAQKEQRRIESALKTSGRPFINWLSSSRPLTPTGFPPLPPPGW